LGGETCWKKPLARPRRSWEDNIEMDLEVVAWGSMDWIDLALDRDRWLALVNAVVNRRVPYNAGNFLTSRGPVGFSERTLLHGVSWLDTMGILYVFKNKATAVRLAYLHG
jgi:hypothetical protein